MEAFMEKFKIKTSVERSSKRILVDYSIEAGKCRSSKKRFARATIAAIKILLDAWIEHTGLSVDLMNKNSRIDACILSCYPHTNLRPGT
jgi:hypothetical protein